MTNSEIFSFLKSLGVNGQNIKIVDSPMFTHTTLCKDTNKIISKNISVETIFFNNNIIDDVFNNLDNEIFLYRNQYFSKNMGFIRYYSLKNGNFMKNRKLKLEKLIGKNG